MMNPNEIEPGHGTASSPETRAGVNHPGTVPGDAALKAMPWLLVSAGLFSWAIRGSSGFGAIRGCVFAGLLWGVVWYFLSKEKDSRKSRRYGMGWSVAALTLGIGISGLQGWGDIVAFVRGSWEGVAVPQYQGFVYMFFLGFHWIGTGVLFLAWTGSKEPATNRTWIGRIVSVVSGSVTCLAIAFLLPASFLPGYAQLDGWNFTMYPKLGDLLEEVFQCLTFTGAVLGGLVHEVVQKDWVNVKLVVFPSLFVGLSWMALIALWELAVPPAAATAGISFNWWRCWESTGGGAMGGGLAIAFHACNKRLAPGDPHQREMPYTLHPNAERLLGIYLIVGIALAYSVYQGIIGWVNIAYPGLPDTYIVETGYLVPVALLCLLPVASLAIENRKRPFKPLDGKDVCSEFMHVFLIVYVVLRAIGLQVTWAPTFNFSEVAFFVYYIFLAAIDLVVIAWFRKRSRVAGAVRP